MKVTSLSASKIKTGKLCKFKFYLEYVLMVSMGKSFAAEQGSLVHKVLEEFGKAKRDNIINSPIKKNWIDILLNAYQKGFAKEGSKDPLQPLWQLSQKGLLRKKKCNECEYFKNSNCFITNLNISKFDGCPKNDFDEAIGLVEKVINDPGCNNPFNSNVIDVENRFTLEVGEENIKVNGIIDIVTQLDKDTVEIIDYKTGSFMMSQTECSKDPQLLIYHLAARKKYPNFKNILITIYYLKDKPITLAFTPKDEKGTVTAIIHNWHELKNIKIPERRCDRNDGTVNFDWKCKSLCAPEVCKKQWEIFQKEYKGILNE